MKNFVKLLKNNYYNVQYIELFIVIYEDLVIHFYSNAIYNNTNIMESFVQKRSMNEFHNIERI